jgi:hypothetical protein
MACILRALNSLRWQDLSMHQKTLVDRLVAKQLRPDGLSRAFSLIQASGNKTCVDEWLRRCMADSNEQSGVGVIAVEDLNGYVRGLMCYRVTEDLVEGRTFDVLHMVLPGLVRQMRAFQALVDAAHDFARNFSCSHVRIALPEGEDEANLGPALAEAGLSRVASVYSGGTGLKVEH